MGKAVVKGMILGGIVAFVWGFISWVILPWHNMTFNPFQDEARVAEIIKANAPVKGIYVLPFPGIEGHPDMTKEEKKEAKENLMGLMKQGPMVFAAIRPQGLDKTNPALLITAFLTQLIAAGLISWLLLKTSNLSYFGKVFFVMIVAFTGGVLTNLPKWNWWGFSSSYTIVELLDLLIGWFFVGLVLAKVVHLSNPIQTQSSKK